MSTARESCAVIELIQSLHSLHTCYRLPWETFIVSKIGLFCTSLVPALIAGGLSYLMVMTFLNRTGDMGTMLMVICGITLAASAVVALSPFGILIFSPKTEEIAPETVDEDGADDDFDDDDVVTAGGDDEDDGFGDAIPDDFDPDELAEDDDDFDIEDDMEIDDLDLDDQETFELDGDDFDFDEDEFE